MNHEILVGGNIARDIIHGSERFGGSAATIAINASRLGLSAGLVSVVGSDQFSGQYEQFLIENKIETDLIERSLARLPDCVVTIKEGMGENIDWIDNGSHKALENMKLHPKKFLKYGVVHLVSCPTGFSKKIANLGLLNLSFEPGPYIHVDSSCFNQEIIDKSKLLFFNEIEYQAALQITGYKSPKDFVKGNNRILVVTKGEKGSDIFMDGEELVFEHIDAIKLDSKVVDTTGAGDCYKAGFLAGYIRGRTIRDCAQIGSYMGAACVTQEGGVLSLEIISTIKELFKI